jgi:hypothetical protein
VSAAGSPWNATGNLPASIYDVVMAIFNIQSQRIATALIAALAGA